MARMLDVARTAGVSRSTVSNVFNSPERVRPEIRKRVEAAARALNYGGPDPRARALRAGKANAIGLVLPVSLTGAMHHSYLRNFIGGVAEVCDEHHAGLALLSAVDRKAAARGVREALVDGFVLHNPAEVEMLVALAERRGLPFVAVDMDAPAHVSSILLDNRGGARRAARHLLDLGHRRFAVLSLLLERTGDSGPFYHPPGDPDRRVVESFHDTRERLAGFADALADAGIAIGDVPIVESRSGDEDAARGAALLLDRAPEVTAVLAMADDSAIALMEAARRRGIAVPADLSVVGFDDIPQASLSVPPLTTVAQPIREKGRRAAQYVFNPHPPAEPQHVVLPVELVVRASTAPPRSDGRRRG
jgi:DNA-binding LacI/PurR family transcriptional regulator